MKRLILIFIILFMTIMIYTESETEEFELQDGMVGEFVAPTITTYELIIKPDGQFIYYEFDIDYGIEIKGKIIKRGGSYYLKSDDPEDFPSGAKLELSPDKNTIFITSFFFTQKFNRIDHIKKAESAREVYFYGYCIELIEYRMDKNGNEVIITEENDIRKGEMDRSEHFGFLILKVKDGMVFLRDYIVKDFDCCRYTGRITFFDRNNGVIDFINGQGMYFTKDSKAELTIRDGFVEIIYEYDYSKPTYKELAFGKEQIDRSGYIIRKMKFKKSDDEEWKFL